MPLIPNYRKTRGIIETGDRADQPAAADVLSGTLYCVEDEGVLERSTGAAWEEVAVDAVAGDFTPFLGGDSGAPTHSVQTGRYVKVGKQVWCAGRLTITNVGTLSGNVYIAGLPFTSGSHHTPGLIGYFSGMTSNVAFMTLFVSGGSTYCQVFFTTAPATSMSVLAVTDISNSFDVLFTVNYEASA